MGALFRVCIYNTVSELEIFHLLLPNPVIIVTGWFRILLRPFWYADPLWRPRGESGDQRDEPPILLLCFASMPSEGSTPRDNPQRRELL